MSLSKFINLFEQEFDDLPKGSVQIDRSFKEIIQLNSMNVLMLLGLIKVEYDIDVTVEDVNEELSFKEFYEKFIEPIEIKNGK